jgi:formate-dependent nitrite reductase membrane component NrfD
VGKDKKDVPYDAPWTKNLEHRPDPNRVSSLQTPTPGQFMPRPSAAPLPADPATLHQGRTAPAPGSPARAHDPQATPAEPSYYNVPMLKPPVWKWQIASYFYLGGLSAGAYVIGRAAERAGGGAYRDLARIASYLALGSLIPCPPLLIADLGDPKRFHHMLRVWKPSSPMNFGTWAITAYSGMATYEVVRQYLAERDRSLPRRERSKLLKLMNHGALLMLHDAAGVPFALVVAGYTGVLLSCTANPLWCKNPFLGPLFSASAISTGAEAIGLAMDCTRRGSRDGESHAILRQIDTAAHVAELGLMKGFLSFAGEKANPLRKGKMSKHHKMSLGGIILAEVLKLLPVPRRLRRPVRIVANLLGLGAGFSMRWSMVFGGHEAADDPHLSRAVSHPQDSAKRIGGTMRGAGGRLSHAHPSPRPSPSPRPA